jgi:N6-adenosine-specific RNA methylase IME4
MEQQFTVVVADPPWEYKGGNGGAARYPCMAIEQLEDLGDWVRSVTAPRSVLLCWSTWPMLEQALRVLRAWGYTYRTAIPWVKTSPVAGKLRGGRGVWFRGVSEVLLVGARGRASAGMTALLGLLSGEKRQFYAPRQEHSFKPTGIYDYAVNHVSEGPNLELFARYTRDGWTCLGHETGWHLTPIGPVSVSNPVPWKPNQGTGWWAKEGRPCGRCETWWIPRREAARWCSSACRQAAYRVRSRT